ncbi:MAG: hypothetical protein R3291_04995 [Thermoplasmata archaeon]|nr:hypothetical protein [Thermoplasmata archaeon]
MAVGVGAYLALGSAIIGGVFAVLVFRQYARGRKVFQLVWGLGLSLFALASLLEFVSELQGWSVPLYRAYFALHPTLVAVLGLGTVYLLADKRVGHAFLIYISGALALLLALTLTAPVDEGAFVPGRVVGAAAMPDAVRNLSLLFTIPGAAALIGGALYSWYRTRWSYNLLIAGGAAIMSLGGTLTRLGQAELLYIFLLVGIALMFVGFLRSLEVSRAPTPEPAPSSAE